MYLRALILLGSLLAFFPRLAADSTHPVVRVSNTTLVLPASAPTFGFTTTNAFDGLSFNFPVALRTPPGETNRLFVAEKPGRIVVITNLTAPTVSVFLDLTNRTYFVDEGGLLSFAFHPQFASNGFVFVYYTLRTNTAAGTGIHDRIARFTVSPTDPNRVLSDSEVPLLTQWREQGSEHHGGDMHFGPDGYLYVSLGDESGSDDSLHVAQNIDKDFFAGILRLDVDKRLGSLPPNPHPAVTTNYAIPSDNPFVGATTFNTLPVDPLKVRTEYWAKGLRNPWRMSFDPITGFLYCGDVGQATWEEINVITKGGNYGWPIMEGTMAGPQFGATLAGSNFKSIPPILEVLHSSSNALPASAVIGGVVYHGQRLADLTGSYIFGDHVSGNIWALSYDGTSATNWRRIASDPGMSAFGIDPSNGDVLVAIYYAKSVKRLIYLDRNSANALPLTLADTGAFSDLVQLTPNPGVVPYDVNVSFWSDHAQKRRWFTIPDPNSFISVATNGQWSMPSGVVWIKHFELELTNGVATSSRRIETRLLVHNSARNYYGITYRWDNSQTNATLVPYEGMDEPLLVHDGGTVSTQVWHYPSRTECLVCHNSVADSVLGFRPEQLNGPFDYGKGQIRNQLAVLAGAGYFGTNSPNTARVLSLAKATNNEVSLEFRTRSYLAANCAQCHQPGGLGQNSFDARIETPTDSSGLIRGRLLSVAAVSGDVVIAPGDLDHSEIFDRIATLGNERMPPLASTQIDTQAVQLLTEWITTDLTTYESYADWQIRWFGSTNMPSAQPKADPDGDGAPNALEYITGTSPLDGKDVWQVLAQRTNDQLQIRFEHLRNRAFQVQVSSDPSDPSTWQPLNSSTELWFPSENYSALVTDRIDGASRRFYRVLILSP